MTKHYAYLDLGDAYHADRVELGTIVVIDGVGDFAVEYLGDVIDALTQLRDASDFASELARLRKEAAQFRFRDAVMGWDA